MHQEQKHHVLIRKVFLIIYYINHITGSLQLLATIRTRVAGLCKIKLESLVCAKSAPRIAGIRNFLEFGRTRLGLGGPLQAWLTNAMGPRTIFFLI
jgi:hypothetical protein